MPENGSLLIFACAREPGVAAKRSAIEFAHSGRTLDRKEGSSHSFWSYCLASRLRQSNSPVARLRLPLRPLLVGPPGEGGPAGDGLLMAFTLFSLRSITSFHGSGPQVAVSQPSAFLQGKRLREGRAESSRRWGGAAPNCLWTATRWWGSVGANCRSLWRVLPGLGHISVMIRRHCLGLKAF